MAEMGQDEVNEIRRLMGAPFYKKYRALKKKEKDPKQLKKMEEQIVEERVFVMIEGDNYKARYTDDGMPVEKKKKKKKKKTRKKTRKMSPAAKKEEESEKLSPPPKLKISPLVALPDAMADGASMGDAAAVAAVEPLHQESERMVAEALSAVGDPVTMKEAEYETLLEQLELADLQYKKEQENAWLVAGKEYPPMKDSRKIQTLKNQIHEKNRLPRIAEIYKRKVAEHMPAGRDDLREVVMKSSHVVNPKAVNFEDDIEGLLIDIPREEAGAPLSDLLAAIDEFQTEEDVYIKSPSQMGNVSGLHIHAVPISKSRGHRKQDFEITMRFNDKDDGGEIGTVRIRGPHSMLRTREWSVPVGRRQHPKNKTIKEKHDIKYGKIPEEEDGTSLQKIASLGGQLHQSLLLAVENPEFWGGAVDDRAGTDSDSDEAPLPQPVLARASRIPATAAVQAARARAAAARRARTRRRIRQMDRECWTTITRPVGGWTKANFESYIGQRMRVKIHNVSGWSPGNTLQVHLVGIRDNDTSNPAAGFGIILATREKVNNVYPLPPDLISSNEIEFFQISGINSAGNCAAGGRRKTRKRRRRKKTRKRRKIRRRRRRTKRHR